MAKKGKFLANPSRRRHLRGAAVWAVAATLPLASMRAIAGSKASKADVQYQDAPKDGKRCDECIQYRARDDKDGLGTCTVVEGEVKAEGYCIAYSAKG